MPAHSPETDPAPTGRATATRLLVVLVATVIGAPVLAFTALAGAISGGLGLLLVPLPVVAAAWVGSEAMLPAGPVARRAGATGPVVGLAAWGAALSPTVSAPVGPVITAVAAGLVAAAIAALPLRPPWWVAGAAVLIGIAVLAWLGYDVVDPTMGTA
ncbi:hypothetical protein AAG589_01935 [Isoptericola sp. F-RaC21]|uniref:hypothetical protein n=1 Tax=Isoptericola sp. F-RaC21 TaxID=3141452 RepID=UPI00315BC1D0